MLIDLFIYSFRNLRNRKLRTWLTMIGIFIGVASIIALIGLGNGLKSAILNQFNLAGADVLSITASGSVNGPPGQGVLEPLTKDYADEIDRLPYVETAVNDLIGTIKVEFNDVQTFEFAQSLPTNSQKHRDYVDIFRLETSKGRIFNYDEKGRIIIGDNFASKDTRYGKKIQVGDKVLINGKSFEVSGIIKKKGSFIIDDSLWLNEDELRVLIGKKDDVNVIDVRAKSKDVVSKAKAEIEKYLRKKRDVREGEEDFSVETSESSLQNLNSILNGIQIFVLMVAAISMIVGAIGIINTMFTAVVERTREIGIMKAIGAKNSDVFYLFFIESGLLGLIGGIIGTVIGYTLALMGTSFLSKFFNTAANPNISVMLVLGVLLGSFTLGAISGIIPAMKAANMEPVKALRG